jgi:hypothetical protein
MHRVKLSDVCHARSGDKGDTVNIGIICYEPTDYPWIVANVTTNRVLKHFGHWVKGPARRFELPRIGALNFLIEGALDGGVTKALMIDGHGKGYSTIILEMEVETNQLPASLAATKEIGVAS